MAIGPWDPLSGPTQRIALEVLLDGPLSRAELSRRINLSAGSLTRLVAPLLETGLLVEVEPAAPDARVGRPSRPLDVVPGAHHFVGIKLTGETAHGVLTNLRAEVLASAESSFSDRSPEAIADTIASLAHNLAQQAAEARDDGPGSNPDPGDLSETLSAIGVSLGGHILGAPGVVESAPYLEWRNVPLGDLVQSRTGVPTAVSNDLTALTEAIHWFGVGREAQTFALVTIGAGVGFGLVIHGRLMTNPDASLGLVGHVPLDPFGPVCFLGHRGCAAALLTVSSISAQVSVALGRTISYDEALDLAEAGNPAAARVINDAGHALGRFIAAIANLTMVETIVLGGEGVRLATTAREPLLDALHADRHPDSRDPALTTLNPEFTEWARGAAVIAIQTFVLGP